MPQEAAAGTPPSSARPSSGAVGSRKPHRKGKISSIATALFERQGYHATTMDDIASATGLNKATVYHYYSSKQEILYDIYASGIDAILDRFAAQPGGLSPSEVVAASVTDVINVMAENISRTAVYYQERPFIARWFAPEVYAQVRMKEASYRQHVQEAVEAGIRIGVFRDVDARAAALTILGAAGQTYQWYRPGGSLSIDEAAHTVRTVLLPGLLK